MFDFSWSEILLIGVVALVVIGPKDLPRVLRTVGQWVSRARVIAREFQGQIDQMVRDSELEEVRKTVNAAVTGNPNAILKDYVDPTGEMEKSLSAPELLGETATPASAATETPVTTIAPTTIDSAAPNPYVQTVQHQEPSAPSAPPAPAATETADAAEVSSETAPKSGTHG